MNTELTSRLLPNRLQQTARNLLAPALANNDAISPTSLYILTNDDGRIIAPGRSSSDTICMPSSLMRPLLDLGHRAVMAVVLSVTIITFGGNGQGIGASSVRLVQRELWGAKRQGDDGWAAREGAAPL